MTLEERRALARLVASPIYELVPLANARDHAAALLAAARVTVTTSVRLGIDATLELAAWLSSRGHDVAPHIAARLIRDRAHLVDVVARMRATGLRKIFVVGGDGNPVGEVHNVARMSGRLTNARGLPENKVDDAEIERAVANAIRRHPFLSSTVIGTASSRRPTPQGP